MLQIVRFCKYAIWRKQHFVKVHIDKRAKYFKK